MVAGRPQIWTPFARISWARDYQYTNDGRIRDKHRNLLIDRDYNVTLRLYGSGRNITFLRRDILALEYFGFPPRYHCVICDKVLRDEVVHLNGNLRDFSRDNLKYLPSFEAREHEIAHIRWAMTSNEVPPYGRTKRKCSLIDPFLLGLDLEWGPGLRRQVGDDHDYGPTWEEIPLPGANGRVDHRDASGAASDHVTCYVTSDGG